MSAYLPAGGTKRIVEDNHRSPERLDSHSTSGPVHSEGGACADVFSDAARSTLEDMPQFEAVIIAFDNAIPGHPRSRIVFPHRLQD